MKDNVKEITRFLKEKKKAELKGDLSEQAGYCNCIGELHCKNGDFMSAIDEHKEELNLCEALYDKIGQAVAYRRIGECLMELGHFKDAIKNQKRYLEIARSCHDKTEQQRAWATLGHTYLCQYENLKGPKSLIWLQQAEEAFKESLEISNNLRSLISPKEYDDMRARLILNLGIIQDNKKNTEDSIRLIKNASTLVYKHDLYEIAMRCQFNLAQIFLRLNKYPDSIQAIIKCIECCTKTRDQQNKRDSMIFKAKIHVELEDFVAAESCLKDCQKMCKSEEDKKYLRSMRASVQKLRKLHGQLKRSDNKACLVDFEKMADLAAKIGAFHVAITYYLNTLRHGEVLGKTDEEMKDIYNSLAQTYCDTNQYEQSLKYYNKELRSHQENHEQMSRTWLNIADVQERAEYEYTNILTSINRAYEFSKKAKHKKLQIRCLKHVAMLNETFGKTEEHEKAIEQYQKLKDKLCVSDSEEDDDEEDDDADEDLIDSDSDGEESVVATSSRKGKRYPIKLNEKGESELHVACIKGNLKKVTQLVERGHPTNNRDFCGWTPLHEVCNHGFSEVAEYLISKGASVNDRGGPKCEGVTPLHDACTNGHIDIIELLMRKGANLHAKDHSGRTPFDCLRNFHKSADLDDDENVTVTRLEQRLHFKMTGDKNPLKPIKPQQRLAVETSDDESCIDIDVHALLHEENSDEEEPENENRVPLQTLDVSDLSSASGARNAYRDIMKSMRKGGTTVQLGNTEMRPVRHSALIPNKEDSDDWLVQDIPEPTSRPRNRNVDSFVFTSGTRKRKRRSSSDSENVASTSRRRDVDIYYVPSQVEQGGESSHSNDFDNLPDIVHTRRNTSINDENSVIFDNFDDDINDEEFLMINYDELIMEHDNQNVELSAGSNLSGSTVIQQPVIPTTQPPVPAVSTTLVTNTESTMRIKVNILEKLLLIPLASSERDKTIEWLCGEVSSRYFQLYKIRPLISLKTHDGAILCPNDQIVLVLSANEQLEAVFIRWDLQPLPERYKDACTALTCTSYKNIRSLLQKATPSTVLDLSRLFLRVNQLQPIFGALQWESTLTELILHGNRMDDTGIIHLKTALNSMSNLNKLDLSSNQLTSDGLKELTSIVLSTVSHKPLQNLRSLNLGFNFLGDRCLLNLVPFLRNLTSLTHLDLISCKLTSECFTVQPCLIIEAFKGCSLTSLDMSYNRFANKGIELLLKCLNPRKLTDLTLTSTVPSASSAVMIPTYIQVYLKQPGCVLKNLRMDNCYLPDDFQFGVTQNDVAGGMS